MFIFKLLMIKEIIFRIERLEGFLKVA